MIPLAPWPQTPAAKSHCPCKHGALPNLFSLLLIILVTANYFVPFADLDFTWQIRTGEQIVRTGSLRPADAFTYTITGQQVPEFEWLYEVLLWCIWSVFGFGGLKLLKTVLVIMPCLLLSLRLRKEGVRWHGITLALLTAIFLLSQAWNLRPLYCTTIGLLVVSGWLRDFCMGRRPWGWWLPPVLLLWGNLHPGVIAGQGLLVGAIIWEWLNRWLTINPPLDREACGRLMQIAGLALVASCICPHPLERLLYPFRPEVSHPIQHIFSEMQPLYRAAWQPPYTLALVYVVAALVGFSVVLRFRHYRLWEVGLLLGLAGLANLAVRCTLDWLMILLALGVPHFAVLLQQTARRCAPRTSVQRWLFRSERACKRMFQTPFLRFQWYWPAAALTVLAAASLVPALSRGMPIQNAGAWPVQALDWTVAHGLRGRFFGPPDYGSYVGWRLGDAGQCYVDTRGFFFPHELLEDSHYVPQLGPDWRSRLRRILAYGTDYFLLETTGPRGKFWRTLQPYLGPPVYVDGQTVLLTAEQVQRAFAAFEQGSQ
ncbi:MAG TPA: hypothetical protein VKU02_17270 [Gemmataceae bacterium]|nr:hypothetical protein [Gemmataceae bacterium]